MQNVGQVKSSVDDLTMERGTVSTRVAFVLRSAEVQPLFRDLCDSTFDMPVHLYNTLYNRMNMLDLAVVISSPPLCTLHFAQHGMC